MNDAFTPPLDVEKIRADFPILHRNIGGQPLAYLDSAATSQRPRQVEEAMRAFSEHSNANISRSVHTLGAEATEAYEGARAKVAGFIGAPSASEIVFTKNVTESINLVAYSMLAAGLENNPDERLRVGPGDNIVVTEMEHHANLIPWQELCKRTGATLKWIGARDDFRLDVDSVDTVIDERTKLVAMTHMSNLTGTRNPLGQVTKRAKEVGALVLVDAAQSVPKMPIDVTEMGADFVAFTGHKMLGPTGIGVLWGRAELLESMPPFLSGGSMISTVSMEGATFAPAPAKFEAGTPPISAAVGLAAAIDYLENLGMDRVAQHDKELVAYALPRLEAVEGVQIIGPRVPIARGATISFTFDGVHPHDVGQVLDSDGVAVRVGHHCAKPLCNRYGVTATTRLAGYVYTTTDEIDRLVASLEKVRKVFSR